MRRESHTPTEIPIAGARIHISAHVLRLHSFTSAGLESGAREIGEGVARGLDGARGPSGVASALAGIGPLGSSLGIVAACASGSVSPVLTRKRSTFTAS